MERNERGPRKSFGGRDSGRDSGSRGPSRFGSRDSGYSGSRGGPRNNFGPKEMHKATCADCGNECEVPFKPTEGRPVYCRECFSKHQKPRF